MQTNGQYIYAISDASIPDTFGPVGIQGSELHALRFGDIAALVSDLNEKRLRPERRNLAAHNSAIKRVMEEQTVLPIAFGMIAENDAAVLSLLEKNADAIRGELEHVRDKVEMGVRVMLDIPNVFEYFVNRYSELTMLRDRIINMQHSASQLDKIELGRVFERILNSERERHTNAVLKVLKPLCSELVQNPQKDEREVMHLACLILRDDQQAFEEAIFEAAKLFNNDFAFDFNGPWAPHHFISLNLEA